MGIKRYFKDHARKRSKPYSDNKNQPSDINWALSATLNAVLDRF